MDELPWEKRFHFHDGSAAKDLLELKEKIETISYDEFYRYVGEEYNHFASWIEHVLQNKGLAERLRQVTSIVETVELLSEELHGVEGFGSDDLQSRIEQEIFHHKEGSGLELPESVEDEPESRIEEEPAPLIKEEPRLPSRDELEFEGRTPRAPVITSEPAHRPITWKAEKAAPEEHMRFITKERVVGFLIGLVTGLILGRILSLV